MRKPSPRETRGEPLDEAWGCWIELLETHCECRYPVIVQRRRMTRGDSWGQVQLVDGKSKHFLIHVHALLPRHSLCQMLIHEWAHALCWFDRMPEGEDHGAAWGRAYYKCYQAVWDL